MAAATLMCVFFHIFIKSYWNYFNLCS